MSRDLRDPQEIGMFIKLYALKHGWDASVVADTYETELSRRYLVAEADGVYVGPLQRYGDPRA